MPDVLAFGTGPCYNDSMLPLIIVVTANLTVTAYIWYKTLYAPIKVPVNRGRK